MIASLDKSQGMIQMEYLLEAIEKNKKTDSELTDVESGGRKLNYPYIETGELRQKKIRFCVAGFDNQHGNTVVYNRPLFTVELTKEELMDFVKRRMPEYTSDVKKELNETISWHRAIIENAKLKLKELEDKPLTIK